MEKSLDTKLARIHADPHGCKDFILADAKDADMALSIGAPGRSPESYPGEVRYRTLAEFRSIIEELVAQKLRGLRRGTVFHHRTFGERVVADALAECRRKDERHEDTGQEHCGDVESSERACHEIPSLAE